LSTWNIEEGIKKLTNFRSFNAAAEVQDEKEGTKLEDMEERKKDRKGDEEETKVRKK
jgi:hypothetical protein